MKTQVLVVDANTAFATMIKQALEDLGEYQVSVVGAAPEAIGLAAQEPFDVAIVDMGLPDVPGEDTVRGLRATRPQLPVIVIPFGVDPGDPMFEAMDVQGFLSKPFFLPDLVGIVEDALERPVNGVTPPPRKTKPGPPDPPEEPAAASPVPARRPLPAETPPWLQDGIAAASRLASVVRQTSAEAGLLIIGSGLVAQAGALVPEEAEALARLVLETWSADRRASQRSFMRYVTPLEGGANYLLYATAVTPAAALGLVYKSEVQVGLARKQAREAAAALLEPPDAEAGRQEGDTEPTPVVSPRQARQAPATAPLPPEALFDFAPAAVAEAHPVAVWTDVTAAGQAPPEMIVDSGLNLPPESATTGVGRTPHALYSLTYSVVWAPKYPRTRLIGSLPGLLNEWIRHLALAYDWQVDRVEVRPECVVVVVSCSPATAPEQMITVIKRGTSDRVLAEFASLAADHPGGDFWAPGYLLLGAGQSLTPQQIADFLAYTRKSQGVGR